MTAMYIMVRHRSVVGAKLHSYVSAEAEYSHWQKDLSSSISDFLNTQALSLVYPWHDPSSPGPATSKNKATKMLCVLAGADALDRHVTECGTASWMEALKTSLAKMMELPTRPAVLGALQTAACATDGLGADLFVEPPPPERDAPTAAWT